MPGPTACVAVAGALGAAAVSVALPGRRGVVVQLARVAVAGGLFVRGLAGVTGRTHLLLNWTPTEPFLELDRRFYGPACLALAALAATSLRRRRPRG